MDHRAFTLPLFVFGAIALPLGLLSIALDASTGLAVPNAPLVAVLGAVALVAATVVSLLARRPVASGPEIIPIPVDPRVAHNRKLAGVLASVGVVLLVAMLLVGGATYAGITAGDEGLDTADVAGVAAIEALATEEFEGSLQGAMLPAAGGIGGTGSTDQVHALAAPAGATAYRIELVWDASGSGAAQQLQVRLEAQNGDAWEVVGTATGAGPLTLDVTDLPGDQALRVRASIPEGSGSTPISYTLHASAFLDTIPEGFTAIAQE